MATRPSTSKTGSSARKPISQTTTTTTTRKTTTRPPTPPKEPEEIVVPGGLKFSKVIVWIMYVWVMIGVVALTLRVFLLLTSANTVAGFANFVMRLSADYLQPFRNIYTGREGETGYLDVSAIFAIIVYLFIAWGIHSLINYVQNKIDQSVKEQKAIGRVKKVK